MLVLRYFGPFEARLSGVPVRFATRPASQLVALLASRPGLPFLRTQVARSIWANADPHAEASSLRTALTMLRRTLGPDCIGADRERVWISRDHVTSDLNTVRELSARERIESDDERREQTLVELAEVAPSFLEGWEGAWILPLRKEHRRLVARANLELARLRLASGDHAEARRLAHRSLSARPGDEDAIAVAARAAVALGDRQEALRLAGQSADSPRLAAEIQRAADHTPQPTENADVLFDAFESGLRDDAENAVKFLLGHHSFWWRQREFSRAKALLRLGLKADLSRELRGRTWHTLAMLEYRTGDFEPADLANRESLDLQTDPARRNDARMLRGALLSDRRDLAGSRAEIESHLALMATEPRDYRTNWVQLNLANLELLEGRTEEARKVLTQSREGLVGADEFRIVYGRAHTDLTEALCGVVEENWSEAARLADAAREILSPRHDPHAAPIGLAISLLARAAQGDESVESRLLVLPLDPVRSGMRSVAVQTFVLVALALAHLGRGRMACELVGAARVLQSGLDPRVAPLDEHLRDQIEILAQRHSGGGVPPAPVDSFAALATWTAQQSKE